MDVNLASSDRAGGFVTFVNPTPAERDAIAEHYGKLKHDGHAILADEVQHADGPTEVRLHHYLSCGACREWRNRGKI